MFKNKISRFSKYSAAAGTLALCGCTMIPDYENPDETYGRGKLDAPEFKHAAGLWKNAAPSDGAPKGEWWAIFGDAKLDALIKACDANNPDIAAAEREVFAANAKIGSDTAAFFPTVSITGDVGFGANKIEDLLGASSLAWGVSPQVYIPIFQAGKIYAQKQTDLAAYRGTVERYKSKVLSAIGEVETSLSNLSHMEGEYAERVRTTDYAKQVQNFTQREYELGNQDYFAVSDAQRQALLHEREQIKLLGARYRQCVALIMSLGGGWTAADNTPPPPKGMYESADASAESK